MLLAVAVLGALLPAGYMLSLDGRVDHLTGRSQAHQAEVMARDHVDTCRQATGNRGPRPEYDVTLQWSDAGEARRGVITRCDGSAPRVGKQLDVWVTPSGTVMTTSAAGTWLKLVFVSLAAGFTVLLVGVSGIIMWHLRSGRT